MLTKMKPPYLGAAYYPELWPLENVDVDIRMMKEAGCNVMRIGEFAWGFMEPQEQYFTFEWLHNVVNKLYDADIAVILCTPTCTPPLWITGKYEETRIMLSNGKRMNHGARRHACPNSPIMRSYNRKIVEAMAKEFGKHPGVIGWQIDNEIHPWGGCFCPICQKQFQVWLKDKYDSIENLNNKWGMHRWSLDYNSFDSILPPFSDAWNHPSLQSAWAEYMSDSYVSMLEEQAEFLHQYTSSPVGTDMMPFHGYDYYDVNKNLDILQFNHYDDETNIHRIPLWFDFVRPIKNLPFWNLETQTCWNGGIYATKVRPNGYCYLNTWLPVAYGAEMNLYWLWKQHPNGHERMHGSVVTASGRFQHILPEIQKVSQEWDKAKEFICETRIENDIAIHFSDTAYRHFAYSWVVDGFNYNVCITDCFYLPITQKHHLNVDLIDTQKNMEKYKIIFSPFLCTFEENNFKERIVEWVKNGGTWIVGPLSDINNLDLSLYTHSPFGILEDLVGVRCKNQIPTNDLGLKFSLGNSTEMEGCVTYDGFELTSAKSLADYKNGFLKGLCAIAEKQIGKGKIILLGTVPKPEHFSDFLSSIGINPGFDASENVVAIKRKGEKHNGLIVLEMRNNNGYIILDNTYKDVLTGEIVSNKLLIDPYQVRVLQLF